MKKPLVYLFVSIILFAGCKKKETNYIQNPSVEITGSSEVKDWSYDQGLKNVIHYFDNVAHDGKKSLFINAGRFAYGSWHSRIQVKPWSVYRFTGWIKTEDLVPESGKGAGFRIEGIDSEAEDFQGTNDWQKVSFEFESGGNDCLTLSCALGLNSRAKGRAWFDDMNLELVSSEKIDTDIVIDITETGEPMPGYIYGQFIEHLGQCIYGGIWAEMIADRKFWYVPGSGDSPWIVSGEKELLTMDTADQFTGAQTPVLSATGMKKVIISQENLGLKENTGYTGRIVLKSTPGIEKVLVTLKWNDKSEVEEISGIKSQYETYPISFKSAELVHDAVLSIEPIGKGKVWVGTLSLMPDDNIEGFRTDVLALLRQLNSPVYRWPGGNFVSGYNWRDGIGDRDRRPPRKNPAWLGIESNDVGIHEFMKFCEILNTEPYIAVNAGLGSANEAMAEVEYTNGEMNTPMGKLRASNGHDKPWKVKWWSIGNEMYGSWQLGHMSTEQFVLKNNDFADKMRSVDPEIKLISVGDVGEWDKIVLANCSDRMDYISEHFYRQDYPAGLMTHIEQIPQSIREKASAHREYRKTIPQLKGKDIRICLDEWNYWYGPHIYGELGTRYFYKDAMGIAAGLNEFSKNTDIIYMANYAQTVNVIGCIKTNTTHSVFDATGQVLKLYRWKFGSIPVKIEGEIRPLNVGATLTTGKDTLVVSVVNPTFEEIEFPVTLTGGELPGEAEIWNVTAPDLLSTNEPGREPAVKITGPEVIKAGKKLKAAPASITIFRFPLDKVKDNQGVISRNELL